MRSSARRAVLPCPIPIANSDQPGNHRRSAYFSPHVDSHASGMRTDVRTPAKAPPLLHTRGIQMHIQNRYPAIMALGLLAAFSFGAHALQETTVRADEPSVGTASPSQEADGTDARLQQKVHVHAS